jgi:hypothetical protein
MSNLSNPDHNPLAHLSDKELAKRLKKTLKLLEAKSQQANDVSALEHLYWILQTERLK